MSGQQLSNLRIGVHRGNVSRSARRNNVRHKDVVCLLEGFNQLKHGDTLSGAQIVHLDTHMFLLQFGQRRHMAISKVHNVNIVADASPVRRTVVVAENHQCVFFAHCHLANIRHQICELFGGILANQSALVCTDRIEVAQSYDIP